MLTAEGDLAEVPWQLEGSEYYAYYYGATFCPTIMGYIYISLLFRPLFLLKRKTAPHKRRFACICKITDELISVGC